VREWRDGHEQPPGSQHQQAPPQPEGGGQPAHQGRPDHEPEIADAAHPADDEPGPTPACAGVSEQQGPAHRDATGGEHEPDARQPGRAGQRKHQHPDAGGDTPGRGTSHRAALRDAGPDEHARRGRHAKAEGRTGGGDGDTGGQECPQEEHAPEVNAAFDHGADRERERDQYEAFAAEQRQGRRQFRVFPRLPGGQVATAGRGGEQQGTCGDARPLPAPRRAVGEQDAGTRGADRGADVEASMEAHELARLVGQRRCRGDVHHDVEEAARRDQQHDDEAQRDWRAHRRADDEEHSPARERYWEHRRGAVALDERATDGVGQRRSA